MFISFLWRNVTCTTSLCCLPCYYEAQLIPVSLSMISIDTVLLCLQTRDLNPNLWNSLAIEFVLSFICHVWVHKEITSHQNGFAWHSQSRELPGREISHRFYSFQTSVWGTPCFKPNYCLEIQYNSSLTGRKMCLTKKKKKCLFKKY